MKIDLVTKLVIHKLRPLGPGAQSDRRGPICDLMLAEIPNQEHAITVATHILQRVCSLLDDTYFWSDKRDRGPSEFTEQFEAWIDPMPVCLEGQAVSIRHKYWEEKKIGTFLDIMVSLADLHGWDVEDRRQMEEDIDDQEFLEAVFQIHHGNESDPNSVIEMLELATELGETAIQMDTSPWRLLALDAAGICWCDGKGKGKMGKVIPFRRKP